MVAPTHSLHHAQGLTPPTSSDPKTCERGNSFGFVMPAGPALVQSASVASAAAVSGGAGWLSPLLTRSRFARSATGDQLAAPSCAAHLELPDELGRDQFAHPGRVRIAQYPSILAAKWVVGLGLATGAPETFGTAQRDKTNALRRYFFCRFPPVLWLICLSGRECTNSSAPSPMSIYADNSLPADREVGPDAAADGVLRTGCCALAMGVPALRGSAPSYAGVMSVIVTSSG